MLTLITSQRENIQKTCVIHILCFWKHYRQGAARRHVSAAVPRCHKMQLSNCSPAAFYLLCYRMRMEVLSCCTRRVSQKKAPLHLVCDMCSRRFDNLQYKRKYSYPVGHLGWNVKKLILNQNFVDTVSPLLNASLKNQMGAL